MGGDGERGKAWLRARGHHLCLTDTNFFFYFFFFFGGGAGELALYFKGTLENNSLFLGNKTNVRECLKTILRNKADHKKIFFVVSLPAHLYSPYPTHFMALLGNNYSFLVLLLEKKITVFFLLRSNVRKCVQNIFQPTYPSQNTG